VGPILIISFEVLGWRKLILIKCYSKIDDVDIKSPLNHPIWSTLLWMILVQSFYLNFSFLVRVL